jgi:putative FmdB family regulatory protein
MDSRGYAMPFYEYECTACKFYVEVLQKISDEPLNKCPSCKKPTLARLMSAPAFRLKGEGWYETDFKSDQEEKRNLAADEEAAEPKAEEPKADAAKEDKKAAEKPAEAKPEPAKRAAKPGAKPAAKKVSKPAAKAVRKPAPKAKPAPKRSSKKPAKGK